MEEPGLAACDAKLVAMVVGGADAAFDALVSRHRNAIYLLARSRVGCREAALDIAQEAFVQAYLAVGWLRDPAAFAPWLRGITVNLCKMHLRSAREVSTDAEVLQALIEHARPVPETSCEAGYVRRSTPCLPPLEALRFYGF